MKRHTKIGLGIMAFICGISLWYNFREDYGLGVDSVGWLPPKARDITYFRNGLTELAEFNIEQTAFERWCAGRKRPLRELGDGERPTVCRPLCMLEKKGVLPAAAEPNEADAHGRQPISKYFGAGDLFYEERWPNNGGYSIGYDIEQRRGYYEFRHH